MSEYFLKRSLGKTYQAVEVMKDEDVCHVAAALLRYPLNLAVLDSKIRRLFDGYNHRSIWRPNVSKALPNTIRGDLTICSEC
jgi:hypothetical protein